MVHPNRRDTLLTMLSAIAAGALSGMGPAAAAEADPGLVFGPAAPFSFDDLKALAEANAKKPWVSGRSPYGAILDKIDYDNFQSIAFRKADALWADNKGGNPIQLFHLGKYFQEPCQIYAVENGKAREILYRQTYFDMPPGHPAHQLPDDIGFSGFRVEAPSQKTDWLAFLGASYFRSSGPLDQYGPSARGLAIDTAMPTAEEFPRFSAFWLERVLGQEGRVIVYALLDSPSVTGAYRIDCVKTKEVVMDIDSVLYPRKPIGRLGIAPLTSMYWYSETVRRTAIDWRPEIHDSDGLAIWSGNGERIWRPLNDPPRVMTNSFLDADIRGFGLLQRDRDFDHYQDDGVFYDRRPSIWVEPKGKWGKGQVQLVELPTNTEIDDNIVVYWVPEKQAQPGDTIELSYRLFWVEDEPYPSDLGRVVSSYVGVGGIPGQPRPPGAVRFVVDFRGPKVDALVRGDAKPEVSLSRGAVSLADAYPVVGRPGLYRAFFDTIVTGSDPLDMRLFVRDKTGAAVTETWLYQYFPNWGNS
ncbi:glucan biosynthesis protein D [Kaistia dalseonensis]|uniref:Glucans biosynthesis protein n=1 Tax=Kaistia dalseonensis TaxID=410840 RepID=A0ABU0HBN6_9HYPH|nr:glucan biosynthesis protein D [Kaistia dalseonensis]MCX5497091.1 glucan biosynthesis protein D [Kaistia dalseonensis]MDQ0439717.1 glucans biosynthesis protein [Kaistia dalseonensis]